MKSGEIAPVTRSGTLLAMLYQRRHLTDCNLKRALEYVCNLDHTYCWNRQHNARQKKASIA